MTDSEKREKLLTISSPKWLVRYASPELQEDILRERCLESRDEPEHRASQRRTCRQQGIQPPSYWRGLTYGWRYVEAYIEALGMTEKEQKKLEKKLEQPAYWATNQDFMADLGNDKRVAFRVLQDMVRKSLTPKEAK